MFTASVNVRKSHETRVDLLCSGLHFMSPHCPFAYIPFLTLSVLQIVSASTPCRPPTLPFIMPPCGSFLTPARLFGFGRNLVFSLVLPTRAKDFRTLVYSQAEPGCGTNQFAPPFLFKRDFIVKDCVMLVPFSLSVHLFSTRFIKSPSHLVI